MKQVAELKSAVLSIGKAIPLIAGALGGVFLPPEKGWSSVYQELKNGNADGALKSATASYTFYNYQSEGFSMGAGTGVKTLVAGGAVTKLIDWLIG